MQQLVLTNANLVDIDGAPRGPATITISGERIESVSVGGGSAPRAPDAKVIDLAGRWVMPGMFNCHYHATYPGKLRTGGWLPVGMDVPPPLQALRGGYHVGLALEQGFTGVVSAGAPFAIDASLKTAVELGIIQGPRIMAGSRDISTTGHSLDHSFAWHWEGGMPPGLVRCDGPEDFIRNVRVEIKRGAEIIKMFLTGGHGASDHQGRMEMKQVELEAAVSTAHERGVKVRAHIASKLGIMAALDAKMDVIDHGDGVDDECIERLLKNGAFFIPSMLYTQRMFEYEKSSRVEAMRADHEHMLKILPRVNKAGVKLLLGDDHGSAVLSHEEYAAEMEYYVKVVGIPARDVLRWATKNGAELMGRPGEMGVVKAGALADLLVLDGDPVENISVLCDQAKLLAVFKGGKAYKDNLSAIKVNNR